MSTAQDTVISTPELLSLIISQLPMRNLLVRAPLVSKTWQAITLSPELQRVLFFLPDNSSAEPITNPLLKEVFPPFFSTNINELDPSSWPDARAMVSMPWAKAPEAFRRPEASWRRMLVRQPPAETILVTEKCYTERPRSSGVDERRGEFKSAKRALCMGEVYDLVAAFVRDSAVSFFIHWHAEEDQGDQNAVTLTFRSIGGCAMILYDQLEPGGEFYCAPPVDFHWTMKWTPEAA